MLVALHAAQADLVDLCVFVGWARSAEVETLHSDRKTEISQLVFAWAAEPTNFSALVRDSKLGTMQGLLAHCTSMPSPLGRARLRLLKMP